MYMIRALIVAAVVGALPAAAQQGGVTQAGTSRDSTKLDSAKAAPTKAPKPLRYEAPAIEIQHLRPADQRGVNLFESPKDDPTPFTGFRLSWGAAFTQQFQNLTHENSAAPKLVNGVDANSLIPIGSGFNNAAANLYLNV